MGESGNWLRFVLAVLATWRLSHLIAFEDGPWDVIVRLRQWAGDSFFGRLMDCFYCVSLWVAAPIVWLLRPTWVDGILLWLALSGGACLLNRIGHDPLVVRTDEEGGNQDDAMLRPETRDREEASKRAGSGAS